MSRGTQWFLGALGIGCLLWVALIAVQAAHFDSARRGQLKDALDRPPAAVSSVVETSPRPQEVIGLLEIPRLGFSEVVVEGDDEDTLRLAIGHLPDTPFPWQPGNSAFAGHRDGRFRPLREITAGDRVHLATRRGDFDYAVRGTRIVSPDDVWVLAPTTEPTLTLITCYPFVYIGKAPQRFVLTATLSGEPVPRAGAAP